MNQPSQATLQRALLPVLFDHQSKTLFCTREPAFVSNWGSKRSVVTVGEGHGWSMHYGDDPHDARATDTGWDLGRTTG
ncbi:MAG: hypothetical protein NZ820_11965 [Dehalococcoidia bacterium]|nr:hypothetical protein [Dehalococcoidia bacterium]